MSGITGSFFTLVMVLANLILQAAFKVLLVFVVLFLMGVLYPFVARALGLPYMTVWELLSAFVVWLGRLLGSTITITY